MDRPQNKITDCIDSNCRRNHLSSSYTHLHFNGSDIHRRQKIHLKVLRNADQIAMYTIHNPRDKQEATSFPIYRPVGCVINLVTLLETLNARQESVSEQCVSVRINTYW